MHVEDDMSIEHWKYPIKPGELLHCSTHKFLGHHIDHITPRSKMNFSLPILLAVVASVLPRITALPYPVEGDISTLQSCWIACWDASITCPKIQPVGNPVRLSLALLNRRH